MMVKMLSIMITMMTKMMVWRLYIGSNFVANRPFYQWKIRYEYFQCKPPKWFIYICIVHNICWKGTGHPNLHMPLPATDIKKYICMYSSYMSIIKANSIYNASDRTWKCGKRICAHEHKKDMHDNERNNSRPCSLKYSQNSLTKNVISVSWYGGNEQLNLLIHFATRFNVTL